MADETVDIRYLLNSDEFARESARIDASIRGTENVVGAAASRMDDDFKRLAKTVGQLGIATALAAAGREVFRFARDFESKMAEVVTLSDEIEANLDTYKQKVIDLTGIIPIMADEAAAALYQIVSAGHDGAEGMAILERSAKAAVAGVTETATAADGITSILNSYQKNASEAESVSDMMFTTVRLGKTTFGELAASIAQVTPTAAAYGVEMDQVLAAVATLTKSGVPTAQAVTQIRQAIIAASKVLGDGAFEGRSLQEALGMIAEKAGGSESKLRALVPEIEAVNGMLGLTGINAETAAEHLDEMTRSAGATEKAFEQQMRDPQKQVDLLKNNLLAAFAEIGDGALNAVGGLAETLNEVFASGNAERLIGIVGTLTAAYGAWRAQLIVTAAARRALETTRYDEESRQLAGLLTKEQQRALGITNLNRLTREQAQAVREKAAAEVQAVRTAAQLAATEKAAATEAYRSALQRSLASKEAVRNAESALVAAKASGDAERIAAAQSALAATQQERHAAAIAKKSAAETYAAARTKAATTATAANTLQTRVATAADTAAARAKNLFTAATARLTRALKALKIAFASNPIGAIITVVTTAATAMALFGDSVEETEEEVLGLARANQKAGDEFDAQAAKIKTLQGIIENGNVAYNERRRAIDELKAIIPEYNGQLSEEGTLINNNTEAIKTYLTQLERQIRLKAVQEEKEEAIRKKRQLEKQLSANRQAYEQAQKNVPGGVVYGGDSGVEYQRQMLARAAEAERRLNQTKQELDQVNQTLSELDIEFVQTSQSGNDGQHTTFDSVSKRVATLRAEITKAESELKALRAPESTATEAQIAQADERLKGLRAQLEIYTGQATKETADALKKQQEIGQALTQVEIDTQTRRVAAMREGKNKRLAEIDLEYRQTLAKISKERTAAKAGGATDAQLGLYDTLTATAEQKRIRDRAQVEKEYAGQTAETYRQLADVFLSEEERKTRATERTYQAMRDKAVEDLRAGNIGNSDFVLLNAQIDKAEEKEQAQNQLERWQKYATERLKIEEDFQQEVARIRKQQRGQTGEDEIEQLREIRDNDLAALAEEMGIKEDEFAAIVDRVVNMGLEQILAMIPQVQEAIDALGDDIDPAVKARLQAQLTALKVQAQNRQTGKDSGDTAKKSAEDWKELQQVLNGVSETFGEVGDAIGGTAGEIVAGIGDIATSSASMLNGIAAIKSGVQGLEAASAYLMIISAGIRLVTGLFSLFSKSHELSQETIQSYEAYIEVTDKLIDKQKELLDTMTGVQALIASEEGVEAIRKQEEATRELGKAYLASRAKNKHSYGVKTEERLRGYRDVIEAAGFDWGELYGSGRMEGLFDLSGEEIERFQRELPQVWAQLDDSTRKYLETLVECKDKMDELGEATNEALTGFTLDDARDELLDFLNDMDATFDDVAGNFEDTMMNAINRVIASGLDDDLKKWYGDFAERMEDGELSDKDREALKAEYERIYQEALEKRDALYQAAGVETAPGAASGLRGEISEKITEETATKLEGLFRVTYDKVAEIRELTADQLQTTRAGFGDVAEILRHQAAIEENTRRTAKNTDGLSDKLDAVVSELQSIKKGGGVYAK